MTLGDMVLVRLATTRRSRRRGRASCLLVLPFASPVARFSHSSLGALRTFLPISQLLDDFSTKLHRYAVVLDPSIWCLFVSPHLRDHEYAVGGAGSTSFTFRLGFDLFAQRPKPVPLCRRRGIQSCGASCFTLRWITRRKRRLHVSLSFVVEGRVAESRDKRPPSAQERRCVPTSTR